MQIRWISYVNLFIHIYPTRLSRGVDGGVHGELPSLYDPLSEAPCLRRTAFNRFKVELLKPCLNDWKYERIALIKSRPFVCNRMGSLPIRMVLSFHASQYFEKDRKAPDPLGREVDFRAGRISAVTPPRPDRRIEKVKFRIFFCMVSFNWNIWHLYIILTL